jgi:hypothetical protein
MAEEKRSVMGEVLANLVAAQRDAPAIGAELRAVFRQGREDAWNSLIPAFPQQSPTRESGAPGTPTPQQTTEALEGREVNEQDRIQEQSRQSRGR